MIFKNIIGVLLCSLILSVVVFSENINNINNIEINNHNNINIGNVNNYSKNNYGSVHSKFVKRNSIIFKKREVGSRIKKRFNGVLKKSINLNETPKIIIDRSVIPSVPISTKADSTGSNNPPNIKTIEQPPQSNAVINPTLTTGNAAVGSSQPIATTGNNEDPTETIGINEPIQSSNVNTITIGDSQPTNTIVTSQSDQLIEEVSSYIISILEISTPASTPDQPSPTQVQSSNVPQPTPTPTQPTATNPQTTQQQTETPTDVTLTETNTDVNTDVTDTDTITDTQVTNEPTETSDSTSSQNESETESDSSDSSSPTNTSGTNTSKVTNTRTTNTRNSKTSKSTSGTGTGKGNTSTESSSSSTTNGIIATPTTTTTYNNPNNGSNILGPILGAITALIAIACLVIIILLKRRSRCAHSQRLSDSDSDSEYDGEVTEIMTPTIEIPPPVLIDIGGGDDTDIISPILPPLPTTTDNNVMVKSKFIERFD
ncbi:hypothetical protein Glove_508g51 [Diversispora epigaea]|uniref:Mid2 domain-containing protein n=1 Tax=Diversispora epigaea TaxID=1348612 RepID=A0A397GJZ0_9GLOM|nr:hypothetical protein Glove_508g51 [Diversispora epigaea]